MHPDPTTLKLCPRCKLTGEFGPNAARANGLQVYCRVCMTSNGKAWRAEHPEKSRASTKAWIAANPEAARASHRAWKSANRARNRATNKAWRAANPGKAVAYTRKWQEANPESVRMTNARRRARQHDAFVEDVALSVLVERDRGLCGICGKPVGAVGRSIDHILPLSLGGQHGYANTRLTHLRCNSARGNRGVAQLRMVG